MDHFTELFCHIDDFCQTFEPEYQKHLIANGKKRNRKPCLSHSEIITIYILFHQLRYRHFKTFYLYHIKMLCRSAFPKAPSYNRFIELYPSAIPPMIALLQSSCAACEGISFVDSTALAVCDNRRIHKHKVFAQHAQRGKTSMGWFYGFKLHIAINSKGELLDVFVSAGNVDDRKGLERLSRSLFGLVFADKGYLSRSLREDMQSQGIKLITRTRKNMKPMEYSPFEETLLKKRGLVETVIDELKNLCQIEHSRHRSHAGFMINLLSGLLAYCWMPYKPSIHVNREHLIGCAG